MPDLPAYAAPEPTRSRQAFGSSDEPVHVRPHDRGLRGLRLECLQTHSKQGNKHHRHDEFTGSRPSRFTERS
jgi:hypothetical protein